MRLNKILAGTSVAIVLMIGFASESQYFSTFAQSAPTDRTAGVAVGPQYDTTHVYVPAADFDRFVASVLQTFGGRTSPDGVFTVTPNTQQHQDSAGANARGNTFSFWLQDAYPISIRVGAHRLSGY